MLSGKHHCSQAVQLSGSQGALSLPGAASELLCSAIPPLHALLFSVYTREIKFFT